MNVLFICDEYPPGKNGGIGTSVQVLGRELVRQGHKVFVAGLYAYSYGQEDVADDLGVKVYRLRYGLNIKLRQDHLVQKLINKIPGFIKQYLNGKQAFARYIEFITSLIEEQKIQVIEIPDWNTFAMRIGFVVEWPKFKAPLLLKSHGSYTKICQDLQRRPKSKLKKIDELLYRRADYLAAVSDDTAQQIRLIFKPDRPIKTLYNGIEEHSEFLSQTKQPKKVIYTGTLIKAKGVFQLIGAWNLVYDAHPDAVLEIYGKGERETLLQLLNERASPSVRFMGHVERSQLFKTLSTATMAVFPSYSESFSLAPMEAMSVGCPVIYTSRSSGKELITSGHNGFLVDPDNINEIAEKVILLIENSPLRVQFSKLGYERIQKDFLISKIAGDHIAYYQHIINNFKS